MMIYATSEGWLPRFLSGRLSDGTQRGSGKLFHAVLNGEEWGRAACGAKPGRLSGSGFLASDKPYQTITCERCRKRLRMD